MSENEHLTAILANLTAIRQYAHNGEVPRYAHIAEAKKHAEALDRELSEAKDAAAFERGRRQAAYTQLAKAEARVGRWKRMALAHDAYEDVLLYPTANDGTDQEQARAELFAAHADLKAHGDLPDAAGEGEA